MKQSSRKEFVTSKLLAGYVPGKYQQKTKFYKT